MLSYQDVLDIGLSPDVDALQARLVAAAAGLGFGLSGGTLIRGRLSSGKAMVRALGNPPDGFAEVQRSTALAQKDPLVTAMLVKDGCHTYDQALYLGAGLHDLWDVLSSFGYRHGMAISIHEPAHLEMFSFGVDSPDPLPSTPAARFELEGSLRLVALYAHEAAKRLWTPPSTVDLNAVTPQEVQALQWAADAVSVWHTRGMTVISHPGREQAQQSAARKLGATSKSQAVLRAIQGGLIDR